MISSGRSPTTPPRAHAAPATPEDLVARLGAGETGAEAELIATYGRPVALLLARHTRSREEAEDLYQETFRLALVKLRAGELREADRLPGFLARLARNLAIEHYRKAGRRQTEPDSETVDRVAGTASSPLVEILDREHAALIRRLIRELGTARDREILLRFYIQEEDKETIAADLGLSSLQFNRVLHRARRRYRELFLEATGGTGNAVATALLVLLAARAAAILIPLTPPRV